MRSCAPISTLFPYTTLFRSDSYCNRNFDVGDVPGAVSSVCLRLTANMVAFSQARKETSLVKVNDWSIQVPDVKIRSEEHTSELQSRENLVCRLLLEKKNKKK